MDLEARFYRCSDEGRVVCTLCPHGCSLAEDEKGRCGVRSAKGGRIISPYLGRFSSIVVDPIEKKPLHCWHPGTKILSLGSVGCNMFCPFCQNHSIASPTSTPPLTTISGDCLLQLTQSSACPSVAYTYNEPLLQAEFIIAAAPLLKEAGISSVMVTNGFMSQAAAEELAAGIDAANIDLKCFNDVMYRRLGGSLDVVKRTIETFHRAAVHVEIACLIVPGISDSAEDFTALSQWLASVSPAIPIHINRYFPSHKYRKPATHIQLLERLAEIARGRQQHVYLGNI